MKTLDNTNLGHFISLLKAAFWPKADVDEVDELDIDNAPTENSDNLVTSGGIYSAISSKYTKPATGIPASDLANGVIPPEYFFVAEYGVTPYADVLAAINAGEKIVVCRQNVTLYPYYRTEGTNIDFWIQTDYVTGGVTVSPSGWVNSSKSFDLFNLNTNNATSLNPSSIEDTRGWINLNKIS